MFGDREDSVCKVRALSLIGCWSQPVCAAKPDTEVTLVGKAHLGSHRRWCESRRQKCARLAQAKPYEIGVRRLAEGFFELPREPEAIDP